MLRWSRTWRKRRIRKQRMKRRRSLEVINSMAFNLIMRCFNLLASKQCQVCNFKTLPNTTFYACIHCHFSGCILLQISHIRLQICLLFGTCPDQTFGVLYLLLPQALPIFQTNFVSKLLVTDSHELLDSDRFVVLDTGDLKGLMFVSLAILKPNDGF